MYTASRDTSVGMATRYGLVGPGIEMPIPEAKSSKTRVCGRSVTGAAGSDPAWGMDVCVVCCTVTGKRQSQDKEVQIKYTEQTKSPGEGDIFRTRPDRP